MPPSIPDVSATALSWFRECSFGELALQASQSLILEKAKKHRAAFNPEAQELLDSLEVSDIDIELNYNFLSWFPHTNTNEISLSFATYFSEYVNPYHDIQKFFQQGLIYSESLDLKQPASVLFKEQKVNQNKILVTNKERLTQGLRLTQAFEKACKEIELIPNAEQCCWTFLQNLKPTNDLQLNVVKLLQSNKLMASPTEVCLHFVHNYKNRQSISTTWSIHPVESIPEAEDLASIFICWEEDGQIQQQGVYWNN